MDSGKKGKLWSAAILVIIVVMYTVYTMQGGGKTAATIGVDDDKIGIVQEDQSPVFIELSDITDVEYTEDLSSLEENYQLLGDENLGAYIVIKTKDGTYVTNNGSKNSTKNSYEEIEKSFIQ